MSKKFRNELEAMTPDQVTEMLGDMCEEMGRLYTDKEIGTVKACFKRNALFSRGYLALIRRASEKNGIEYKEGQSIGEQLMDIGNAVDARGSRSANKIWKYMELLTHINDTVSVGKRSSFIGVQKAYKKLG